MKPAPFDYVRPASVTEAIAALASDENAKLIAGGQSLVPLMAMRLARPTLLVDIDDLGGPSGIEVPGDLVRIDAGVRHEQLENDVFVAREAPILQEAAGLIGHPAIRARGTIGGSLAHADPVAELPAVLVATGGSVVVQGMSGSREITARDLFTGFLETTLEHDEIIRQVHLPKAGARHGWSFCEWAPREGDFAVAAIALTIECDDDGACVEVGAAASGVTAVPLECADLFAAAVGASAASDVLLRDIARSVRTGAGADVDRADLLGLLAARAVYRAFARAATPRELAA